MSPAPRVSIITPTYNHAAYIGDCIASALCQTYREWEQIIIDDGSPDSTPEVVKQYTDPRIHYFREQHRGIEGLARSYNRALELARGELIAILEGDDSWPADKLQSQVRLSASDNVVLSWGAGAVLDSRGETLGVFRPIRTARGRTESFSRKELLRKLLLVNVLVPSSGVVVRRDALDRIGGFRQPKGVPYVDLPTWLALVSTMREGDQAIYVDKIVTNWRTHQQQASRGQLGGLRSQARTMADFIERLDPNQVRTLGIDCDYLETANSYIEARAAISDGDWAAAAGPLRRAWRHADRHLRLRLVIVGLSVGSRIDLFRAMTRVLLGLPSLTDRLALKP